MRSYPKIPRHDHDSVEEELYSAEDLVVLEKTDGQNFRIILYDEDYKSEYTEEILEFNPSDGDVFLGTKGVIQARLSDTVDDFETDEISRLLTYLRKNLDVDMLKSKHDEYNSPLILFGEHMIRHSINYDYEFNPPVPFLGFDVFKLTDWNGEEPDNPFNDDFTTGFLDMSEAREIITDVGLEFIEVLESPNGTVNVSSYDIPDSCYANVKAEGVVFRSDSLGERSKLVSERFKELNKEAWGMREDEADTGEELVSARYLTNGRIRKIIHKHATRGDIVVEDVVIDVIADVWVEEYSDISSIELSFNPVEFRSITISRVKEVLERMKTNARLNDTDITSLRTLGYETETLNYSIDSDTIDVSEESNNIEEEIVYTLYSEDDVKEVITDVCEEEGDDMGRWVIKPVFESIRDDLWQNKWEKLEGLDCSFVPAEINRIIMDYVRTTVNSIVENDDSENKETEDSDTMDGLDLFD